MSNIPDNPNLPRPNSPRPNLSQFDEWARSILRGDVRAVARAISQIEEGGTEAARLLAALRGKVDAEARRAIVVGITGAAGCGKSTLADALISELRKQGRSVGVLAVDPSSSLTGGALLGDRIRMQAHGLDAGVLIRSMATRGALGGVAAATRDAITILEAAGKDYILIETVGVGQDEISVSPLADVTALVLTPGAGDDVQAMKAGVMEMADIFVLNKADEPGIDQLEADVRESLHLRDVLAGGHAAPPPPIIKTVASECRGVPQLLFAIEQAAAAVRNGPRQRTDRHGTTVSGDSVVLDHLGIAVGTLAESLKFYEDLLGLRVSGIYDIPHELTRVAMLPAGTARIELLEPAEADSPIGRFLARRGPGLHHICLRVPDLAAAMARLKQSGARLLNDEPQTGAGGHRYVFVHPSSAGGVLLELVQAEE